MKMIELLLLETVDNLGIVGDVVKVKPGFARNFLLPRSIAEPPTDDKIQELAARRAEVAAELKQQRKEETAMIDKINGFELTLERSANESGALFGGVSQHDIAEALQAEGFAIKDSHIRIGMKINHLDTYIIPIQIAKDLKAEVKLWVVSDKPLEAEAPTQESSQGEEDQVVAEEIEAGAEQASAE